MKKIISILLLAAMLVGCLSSAVLVSAADVALTVESVEKMQGTGAEASAALSIENNPGLSAISFVVYYDKAQLAIGSSDAFAGALASADDSSVSPEYAGTNNKVKNYIPSDVRSASKAFIVELVGAYNDETEATDAIVGDGVLVNIPLCILSEEIGSYAFNVVVIEAYDADGEEIALEGVSGTIDYVADPLVGIYDEFTVFTNPGDVEVVEGTTEISVDVRFDSNPGLWSTRIFVVYPAELSLKNVENPLTVFTSPSDMLAGTPDLALTDPAQVGPFQEYLAAHPEVVRDGYRSTTIYFEPASFDAILDGNGVLCTLDFEIASDVEVGDVLDISIHYTNADFLRAETAEDGTPVFTIYEPTIIGSNLTIVDKICEHVNTTNDHKDATCGEAGYDRVVCADCGATISETVIEATGAHVEGEAVVTESTCSEAGKEVYNCSVCGAFMREVALELADHTPGAEATCQAAQTCTVCGIELVAKLDHIEGTPERTNPTCEEDGKDVYKCTMCGDVLREEIIPATGHSYLQMQGAVIVPPTCTEDGYTTRFCDYCGEPKVTDPVPAWGHDEDGEVVIVESTCTTEGTKTIYCDTCGEVSKVETLPLAAHTIVYVEAYGPFCHTEGVEAHWVCTVCGKLFADENGETEVEAADLVIPAENELAYVPATEACHVPGSSEYWYCPACDCVYADEAGTMLTNRKNLAIAPDCELVHMDAVEPCHANGTYEYWFCPECEAVYADEAGTQLTNRMNLTIPADSEAKHVAKVDATCTANGMAEYWYCEECDTFFADAECKYNVAYLSLTIPATGHDFVDGVCTVCGEKAPVADDEDKKPETDKAPVTGDNMMFIVIALAVVLVAGAAIVLFRRKRFN